MSRLHVDQKSIESLFGPEEPDFLIPDYQRSYAWEETQCQTLWDDIYNFALPDNNPDNFIPNGKYFLGTIVTFVNDDKKQEVIDGQQRLTTILLMLRALYEKFKNMKDNVSRKTKDRIANCIWKADEFMKLDRDSFKIDSKVAIDGDREELINILKTGAADKTLKSNYAVNYRFFQDKIEELTTIYPGYFHHFSVRFLANCILLPIKAESQNTALRIFSTLNDRGLPLSDADIFKAKFYDLYSSKDLKDEFIEQWKELEELSNEIFSSSRGASMDELFTRYMYYERAKKNVTGSTTAALRKFYEEGTYAIFKKEETLPNLRHLAYFWNDIYLQNSERFSDETLKKLFVLNYAPNGMWHYFLSVYFLQNKDEDHQLDEDSLNDFLTKTIAFIWGYFFANPGVNALRTPVYKEMRKIVEGKLVDFSENKFDEDNLRSAMMNFEFTNGRPITKSVLAWWAFRNKKQELLPLNTNLHIEHIYAKKRQENDKGLENARSIESIGNKSFLEYKVNIRAADYRFQDKIKYYNGFTNNKGQYRKGTDIQDLKDLAASKTDFLESDIEERKNAIISEFIDYLKENDLIKQ